MRSVSSEPRPLRALVIGAGATSNLVHLPILASLRDKGEILLSLVCDIEEPRAAAAKRRYGFLESSSDPIRSLQRPDIDTVYVFGTARLHHEYGLMALAAGKHVFVEKPIAPSYPRARELAQAAAAGNLIAVGGHNRRFYKSFSTARAHAGAAGWRYAEAVFHKPEFGKPPPFGAETWLGANGIHALDALVYMMGGLPSHIAAQVGAAERVAPRTFSAIMRWPDGAEGVFLCNNDAGARREEYVFHGVNDTCTISDKGLTIEGGGRRTRLQLPAVGDGFQAEHASFIHAIRNREQPPHAIVALAPSLFLAERIEEGYAGAIVLPTDRERRPKPVPPAKYILVSEPQKVLPALSRLSPEYGLVAREDVDKSNEPRPDVVAAILGHGAAPLTPEILDKMSNLSVVGVVGLSLRRHRPDDCLMRGIALVNASDAYAGSVAEFALGLAILARRRAFLSDIVMHEGGWGTRPRIPGLRGALQRTARTGRPLLARLGIENLGRQSWRSAGSLLNLPTGGGSPPRDLKGAQVGLLGWGASARAFSVRLAAAGARVLAYSQHAGADDIAAAGAQSASLAQALSADIVSLHRGLTPETRHFLGSAELAKLRPGTVLINLARAALIEPQAFVARLRQGDIFACLDTFEEEPPSPSDPLRNLPNVFLTSHIAGGSPDMHDCAADEVVRKVAAFLRGSPVDTITPELLLTKT